ncbi:unnamed protein product [Urochloa decumbens]|uniref:F-box domain-containing protein n=1 Tax=Urochloa decumbens TaxID=240449 RepID=A0ABC9FWI5_9POAL
METMATNGRDEGGGAADRISSLPDHLLHTILLRLRDVAAAARTSALSRRWRRVWPHLPELCFPFRCPADTPVSVEREQQRRVDAALAAHAAPTVTLLDIALPYWVAAPLQNPPDPDRDDPLLRFLASRRVAGELRLELRGGWHDFVLPLCERATVISLFLMGPTLRFQPPPPLPLPAAAGGGGAFAALASLMIIRARVYGRELEDVLRSRCPRLKELLLRQIRLEDDKDYPVLSIHSDSLERLEVEMYADFVAPLQVVAPRLQVFVPKRISAGARIVAPRLLELRWHGPYDPTRHDLREARRHLQRLEIDKNSPAAKLIGQFYAVHELHLTIQVWKGTEEYDGYLQLINRLPKCEVLVVGFFVAQHAIKPVMLHFLNKCAGVKKIVFRSLGYPKDKCQCKSWECQCDGSKQSHKIDDTALGSLEQVEIKEHMEAYHKMEFIKLLCEYSARFQKRVTITVIEKKHSVREKICNTRVPNDKVVINVRSPRAGTRMDS